ncbi:MAG TPA: DNA-formamidopyrimidine glycosylase family protein [Bryobacteraceae bacterium]|jgi:formamidopyrimidine-DNA glycosylase
MPELPDIAVYLEALEARILNHALRHVQIAGPSLLRTADPAPQAAEGHTVVELRRIGKRIAIGFDNHVWLVLHLMIAGRLHWSEQPKKPDGRRTLAAFVFDSGCLTLTEAGTRKRASLHVLEGEAALQAMDPGGIDILTAPLEDFARVLASENHTLKRSLTDPRLFSGIGNAYSDEILHRAQMSPVKLTSRLSSAEILRLYDAVQETMRDWIARLRAGAAGKFPEKVTAFREGMAVHGRYGQPCPRCATKVQRIRHADNETNYCPVCQTGGKLLADRALSRLLREDWPRTLDELEALRKER